MKDSLWRKRQIPDDIIAIARYAGIEESDEYNHLVCTEVELLAFAKLIAEREREACAKIVESNADACRSHGVAQIFLYSNAKAIRARSGDEK
jgi:hypothetical protein